ncbi:spore germination protein [Paenibacillus gansuensis]|uniref:Spore germination protein n=1 Tax=Paenibacillus gansuensis TaxID=306542 RepID=A0ABW5PIN5_9BACL
MSSNTYLEIKYAIKSDDFIQTNHTIQDRLIYFSYYKSIVDQELLHTKLLQALKCSPTTFSNLSDVIKQIPLSGINYSSDVNEILQCLLSGYAYIQLDPELNNGILVNIANLKTGYRSTNETENEYSVIGPKVGLVENLDINLNLLRKEIVSDKLRMEEFILGSLSQTRVNIVYLEGICNPQHINTVRQRLVDFDFDVIFDSSILDQIISDNSNSPFPLFMSSERLDRVKFSLLSGQVAILSNGSPYAITGPSTIFDFFISPEDYYLPWLIGSFFRCLRFFGVVFSIFASPLYVAVLTFHYSSIPHSLLESIVLSRSNVPFKPVTEVLFLEITVEMLREAGSRLPTKIGQTLGIVGGIVLGQAAVQASLTSNILIIIISLSALSSFATPIFKMSNTIRFLRFPLIFLASQLGGLGIMLGIVLLLGHLLRLKSLGVPYLVPLFPLRTTGFADSFIRSSLSVLTKLPPSLRPITRRRYHSKKHKDQGSDYNNE